MNALTVAINQFLGSIGLWISLLSHRGVSRAHYSLRTILMSVAFVATIYLTQ